MLKLGWKLAVIGLIFIAPIVHLITVLSVEKEVEIKTGLNFVPMVLVMVLALVVVSYVFSNIKAKLMKHPFGYLSMLFFGGVALGFLVVVFIWFASILGTAEQDYKSFVENFNFYLSTIQWLCIYIGAGLALAVAGFIKYKE